MARARSSAHRSATSATTTIMDGSRRASMHTAHGFCVSILPHTRQISIFSMAACKAAASGAISNSRFLIRNKAARRAERGPSPGSRANSAIRRSISGPAAMVGITGFLFFSLSPWGRGIGGLRPPFLTGRTPMRSIGYGEGVRPLGQSPLTPTLSPLGRGSSHERSNHSQNSFNPGGSGRPPVIACILSCSKTSSLRRASAWAATIKSSTISFWSGLSSVSSTWTPRKSPLPEIFNVSMPPPAMPSTSMRSSSACMDSIFDFSSAACFIRPRKSGIEIPIVVRCFRHVVGAGGGRAARRAHLDDFGAGEARQHRLHQRIAARVALELGLAFVGLAAQRRRAWLGGHDHHPAPAGPVMQLLRQFADQHFRRARFERDLELAILETHQPHVAFQGALERDVALLGGERDQILEAVERARRRSLLGAAGDRFL